MRHRQDFHRLPKQEKKALARIPGFGSRLGKAVISMLVERTTATRPIYETNRRIFEPLLQKLLSSSEAFKSLPLIGRGNEGEARLLELPEPIPDARGVPQKKLVIKKFSQLKRGGAENQLKALTSLRTILDFLARRGDLQLVPREGKKPLSLIDGIAIKTVFPLFNKGQYYLVMPFVGGVNGKQLKETRHPEFERVKSVCVKLARMIVSVGKQRKLSRKVIGTKRLVTPDLVMSNIQVLLENNKATQIVILDQFLTKPQEGKFSKSVKHVRRKWRSGESPST